ncbi:hypothetical protein SAMN05443667_113154 [Flavobacterium gillisiae]|uniref:Uncharacterized protein n=1 Tax=Flavobacterium gillisiae TaxID=150146 RepID=A0A1H4FIZ6_9FLAO|nr:hypothetical protein SAMN05443667_113154 [Flavobacterium gillisiae]
MNFIDNSKPSERFSTLRKLGIGVLVILILSFYILSFIFLSL